MQRRECVKGIAAGVAAAAGLAVHRTASAGESDRSRGFCVTEFGAVGDGVSLDTRPIQAAVDACAATGGEVLFPPGTWRSGTIVLRSGVTLRLSRGAVLLGSGDLADYPEMIPEFRSYTENYVRRSLIYGEGLDGVGITGEGVIDGNGGHAAFRVSEYLLRPYVIRLISCRGVRVTGITLRSSPMWMQHYLDCEDMVISGIRVFNHGNRNNDMIDLDCCRRVVMSDCLGDTDDDGITIKSTAPRPSEHIAISNCVVSSHCNAIKMGTESVGGFRNIAISNCVVTPSRNAEVVYGVRDGISGIALEVVDGGVMENITISNITIDRVGTPIFIRLGNRGRKYTPHAPKPGAGTLRDVRLSGITARGTAVASSITGIPGHPVENVSLHDIRLVSPGGGAPEATGEPVPEQVEKYPEAIMFGPVLPAAGLYIRHVRGIALDRVTMTLEKPDPRPALVCDDVEELDLDRLSASPPENGPLLRMIDTRNVFIRGSRALPGTGVFLRVEGRSCRRITLRSNDLKDAKVGVEADLGARREEIDHRE